MNENTKQIDLTEEEQRILAALRDPEKGRRLKELAGI